MIAPPAALLGELADQVAGATDAEQLAMLCADLRAARQRLAARSLADILASLNAVVAEWLQPDSIWRREAEALLPNATGFSPAMIRYALPSMIEPLRAPAVAALLRDEIGGRPVHSPHLIAHISAGNLPGHAAIPVALTLALKSAALVKAAQGDRLFPLLWARSLAARDADFGACVAARYWRGGEHSCEQAVCAAADLVVASGSDASVDDLRARCATRFIGHGYKVSFAVVAREAIDEPETAAALARDVAIWDQRGCLSPQVCFVEGDVDAARRFAAHCVAPLRAMARELPPGETAESDALAVRRWRDEAEWRQLAGEAVTLCAAEALNEGTIVVEPEPIFRPTPLCRSLRVLPLARVADLLPLLANARPRLEAAGVAAPAVRWPALYALLDRAGAHRICRLGEMQQPPLEWRLGGRPRVGDWVTRSEDEHRQAR